MYRGVKTALDPSVCGAPMHAVVGVREHEEPTGALAAAVPVGVVEVVVRVGAPRRRFGHPLVLDHGDHLAITRQRVRHTEHMQVRTKGLLAPDRERQRAPAHARWRVLGAQPPGALDGAGAAATNHAIIRPFATVRAAARPTGSYRNSRFTKGQLRVF